MAKKRPSVTFLIYPHSLCCCPVQSRVIVSVSKQINNHPDNAGLADHNFCFMLRKGDTNTYNNDLFTKGRLLTMALMTGNEYVESMRRLNLQVYMFGEKIENPVDHPILRPSLNSVKATYDLAQMPEYEDLMTAQSPITGTRVNRFTHIHQSTDDLMKRLRCSVCADRKQLPASRDASEWMHSMLFTAQRMRRMKPMEPAIMKISRNS